jgi:hypothetical protein
MWDTPANYRRYAGGNALPDKLKVWRVQQLADAKKPMAGTRGVVGRAWQLEATPGMEFLMPGVNTGKMSGAMAVGRHGNFLQWGFSASPDKMTPAGRNFFLNCVVYISKFNGKTIEAPQ